MTKVNCRLISCESNKEGVCTKDEITLSDLFGGDAFDCKERDVKSKIFIGIDSKKRTWGIIKGKDNIIKQDTGI